MRYKPINEFNTPAYVPPTINDRLLYSLENALPWFVVIIILLIAGGLFYVLGSMLGHGIVLPIKSTLSFLIAHAWDIVIKCAMVFAFIYVVFFFIHSMDGDQSIDEWRAETGRLR
jgi:hypothetical protein